MLYFAQFAVLMLTLRLLVYTFMTAFFPSRRRNAIARTSSNAQWQLWLGETENPYSLLNSRGACYVLSPLWLVLLCIEIAWIF